MTKTAHTPTPWWIEGDLDIMDKDGRFTATTLHPDESVGTQADYDNASFIVRAVNSHDALVEALENAANELEAYLRLDGGDDPEAYDALSKARAALQLAKGA